MKVLLDTCNGNKSKFINFIQDSLKNLDNKTVGEFAFTKLDPKENSYRLYLLNVFI